MKDDKFADEMLTDDELDGVAGGYYSEVAGDTKFLNELYSSVKTYTSAEAFFLYDDACIHAVRGWSNFGISLLPSHLGENYYYLDGRKISRREAMEHAVKTYEERFRGLFHASSINLDDY